jgi:predicted RecA/RadA family phage recombinase
MKNFISDGKTFSFACTSPAAPASGNPVRIGNLVGVAVTAEGDGGNAATEATIYLDRGIFKLSVTDSVGGGIAIGDSLFLADGAPPTISNTSTGYFFGTALEAVGVGATTSIYVLKAEAPAAGALGAGVVSAANLAAGAAKANLTTTKATSGELDPTLVQYAAVAVSNAEIKGLRGAPKELVAAPGAGKYLEFISATLLLDYGSNVLTRPNADEDMVVRLKDGAGLAVSEATAAGFPVAAVDQLCTIRPAATQTMTKAQAENVALVLHNDGTAEFGGNAGADTVMRVKVAYRVHATGF